MTKTLRLKAFAKVNLGLKVLAKRRDGYHGLRTIYQTVDLYDRLEISVDSSAAGIDVICNDPAVPRGPENLVHRACEFWKKDRRFGGGIRVCLEKGIPAGAGLGGGSSDAAATLLGLDHLTGVGRAAAKSFELAARLGSDVPLFLLGGRVLGCGRGEEVYPLPDLPARYCLIVFPGFSVSTAEAYRELDRRKQRRGRLTEDPGPFSMVSFGGRSSFPLETWGPAENDFERVVFARWPELASLKRRLIRAGAEIASLTGSGSAVYAIFPSARKLVHAAKRTPAGWQAFRTKTLSRQQYQRRVIE